MSNADRDRWNAKYVAKAFVSNKNQSTPDEWLVEHVKNVRPGRVLDVACGLGHNSRWLAGLGWSVDAIDISPIGLKLAAEIAAQERCPPIQWIEADLDDWALDRKLYDLVIVFRFLDRHRLPDLIENSLCLGGLLIYETFVERHLSRPDAHMKNEKFALQSEELPKLFPSLKVQSYEEDDLEDRSVARLVAVK